MPSDGGTGGYSLADRMRVGSPLEGRGLGVRHAGGGAVDPNGKGGGQKAPTGGMPAGPGGGRMAGGLSPAPGTLAQGNGALGVPREEGGKK